MKIIAGQWRGRSLTAPAGDMTRPTSARGREALFSMLAGRVGGFDGLTVLDCFAGTGALGLEALSRGAAHCTFVESGREALGALRGNVAALDAGAITGVRPRATAAIGQAGVPVDLVFLDAPYDAGLTMPALIALESGGWLRSGTVLSVETSRREELAVEGCEVLVVRDYGKARITLLKRG